MSKKPISATLDEESRMLIERLGKEVLHTDNVSQIIRYAVKYTANEVLKEK